MTTETAASPVSATGRPKKNRLLRLVAIFKFVETFAAVVAGLTAMKLLQPETLHALAAWSKDLPVTTEQRIAERVLDGLGGITPQQMHELGIGAVLFAAIFLAEGIGLWLERRWAEWLSVVATSLFIPAELFELMHRASASKAIVLLLNLLVVGYLVYHIVSSRHASREG